MRGLPIEVYSGFPAVLAPCFLQELDLVRWRDAETHQGKDGRPHGDASRPLNQGLITARTQRRDRYWFKISRFTNPRQHVVKSITQCDELYPRHLRPPVSPKNHDHFWKPGTLSVTGCHSITSTVERMTLNRFCNELRVTQR